MSARVLWSTVSCLCLCLLSAIPVVAAGGAAPSLGFSALFLGEAADEEGDASRMAIQEAELRVVSEVDACWTADVALCWYDEPVADVTTDGIEDQRYATDISVAALHSRSLPYGLGLTLGKFRLPFGKHAELHTHRFHFVRAPYAVRAYFGEHGPSDVGAALSVPVSMLPWRSELTVYGVDGRSEIFESGHRDLAYGARWRQRWDVSGSTSLELSGSYLTGPVADGYGYDRITLSGFDMTIAYTDGTRREPTASASLEVILPDIEGEDDDHYAYYASARAELFAGLWAGVCLGRAETDLSNRRFSLGELFDKQWASVASGKEYKANVSYETSTNSAVRAEISQLDMSGADDLRVSIQWFFAIGSDPGL